MEEQRKKKTMQSPTKRDEEAMTAACIVLTSAKIEGDGVSAMDAARREVISVRQQQALVLTETRRNTR